MVTIRRERYDGPAATALVAALQADLTARYGGPDANPVGAAEFTLPRGVFLVAEDGGEPIGCVGLRLLPDGAGELKRMYVVPHRRGTGVARALLAAVEQEARALGCPAVRLETGLAQPEAMALYRSAGYELIPGYGYYACAPGARSFEKVLS